MKLKDVTAENWEFVIDYPEKLQQGFNLWYKNCSYPRRVYYSKLNDPNFTLRALEALGMVKKLLFSFSYLAPLVVPRTFKISKYAKFLERLEELCVWTLSEFILKDEEWSVPVREMGIFVENFLLNLGITHLNGQVAKAWSQVVMCVMEFDPAYRYRVQDMAGMTTKRLLQNPRQEIKRILRVYNRREIITHIEGARAKINKLELVLYLLWIPKFKKAFLNAIEKMDFKKVQFNDNDRFHFSYWKGYNFEGKTFEQRFEPVAEIFKAMPFQKRTDPEIFNNFLVGN